MRGTTWLTEDYCDTSRVESKEGTVTATAAVEQPQGAAPAPAPEYNLKPGQSLNTFCNEGPPVTEYFCLLLLSQPADNLFGFGILVRNTPFDSYTLCLTGPYRYDCGGYYFNAAGRERLPVVGGRLQARPGTGAVQHRLVSGRIPPGADSDVRVDEACREPVLPQQPLNENGAPEAPRSSPALFLRLRDAR